MATTTALQSLPVPTSDDDPDVVDDMTKLANAIEKRLAGVYNSVTDRDTRITSPEEGQIAYLKDSNTWTFHNGTSWTPLVPALPTFTSGTSVPSNATGSNGDVFFKV